MTARLLGATIGMAVCSALIVATNDFRLLNLRCAGMIGLALVLTGFAMERRSQADPEAAG